jgi:peptidoglycan glycosyltransferase
MNLSSLLTIVIALGLIVVLLSLVRSYRQLRPVAPQPGGEEGVNLPQMAGDFGPRVTSRRIAYVGLSFTLLFLTAGGFHLYWAFFAAGPLRFDKIYGNLRQLEDNRRRRESESTLRGWIFDRHHDTSRTLVRYRYQNGKVLREYPLGEAAVHLTGYSSPIYGDTQLEKVLTGSSKSAHPETLSEKLEALGREPDRPVVAADLVTSIDGELQQEAYEQIRRYSGAVVVLNPQNGQILALASSPGFDPEPSRLPASWKQLVTDKIKTPLTNRPLLSRYSPGSTFKTLVAAAAIEANLDQQLFTCRPGGWVPPGASRPINDDNDHVHGQIGLTEAFTKSCNQYFAQMGVALDRQRMATAANRFGFEIFAEAKESLRADLHKQFWNVDTPAISLVLAPLRSSFVSSPKLALVDLAQESIGQGFVQATPLQMALVAAGVANSNGEIMQPQLELARPPVVMSQAMAAATAAQVRRLMAGVVSNGTAENILPLLADQATAAGKTGTAQREVIVRDPRTGEPLTYTDKQGKVFFKKRPVQDAWFIGFAPVDNPKIAFAVIVEDGGYGGKIAAPIAARLIIRARQLSLLR